MDAAKRVLFMGSKSLGLRVLQEMHKLSPRTLVGAMTVDDSGDQRSELSAISHFSQHNCLPLYVVVNQSQAEAIISNIRPDICIVAGWYWVFGSDTLTTINGGCIGIHNSLLPKYRGGSPLVWSIINDEKHIGVSLFSLSEGIDDGDIWAQEIIEIGEEDYVCDLLCKLEDKALAALRDNYKGILGGDLSPARQNHEDATYCAMRMARDGNINWERPARDVFNFIRAQSHPYPGAFTNLEGKKITIWKAAQYAGVYYGTPGQVARVCLDGVIVICGDNHAVVIKEAESDGCRGDANEILKSIKDRLTRS